MILERTVGLYAIPFSFLSFVELWRTSRTDFKSIMPKEDLILYLCDSYNAFRFKIKDTSDIE